LAGSPPRHANVDHSLALDDLRQRGSDEERKERRPEECRVVSDAVSVSALLIARPAVSQFAARRVSAPRRERHASGAAHRATSPQHRSRGDARSAYSLGPVRRPQLDGYRDVAGSRLANVCRIRHGRRACPSPIPCRSNALTRRDRRPSRGTDPPDFPAPSCTAEPIVPSSPEPDVSVIADPRFVHQLAADAMAAADAEVIASMVNAIDVAHTISSPAMHRVRSARLTSTIVGPDAPANQTSWHVRGRLLTGCGERSTSGWNRYHPWLSRPEAPGSIGPVAPIAVAHDMCPGDRVPPS
jgi:hypothetical protein